VAKLLAEAVKKNPNDVRAQLMLINFHLERRDAKQATEPPAAAIARRWWTTPTS
jgi:cytochrome c-type biogenesis protein CcmH/NrfG